MLNLYKNYIKNNIYYINNNIVNKNEKNSNTIKNFPSSIREWNNSVYTYNKNYIKLLPEANKLSTVIIKSYFNLYNSKLESEIRKSKLKDELRKLSSNKIYVSNGTFKHTNNKIIIQLYVYNRQKINYTFLIKKIFKARLKNELLKNLFLINKIASKYARKIITDKKKVDKLLISTNSKLAIDKYVKILTKNYKNLLMKKMLDDYKKYFYYKLLLYINKSKFNYNYLSYLYSELKKIYNKNIQFDIINLKHFYFNSDILIESILLKMKNNRKKINRKLKYIKKFKVKKVSKYITYKPKLKNIFDINTEPVANFILNNLYKNKKTIKNTALSLIKYKMITGVRIEAKGRLTRRFTASRSVTKLRHKGNLINIDSTYLKMPSVFLKGNLKSNLQYSKLNSKTRVGSFGLKGWISGY